MGKRSQKAGARFESYLDGQHALFEAQGKASVFKVPTNVQITSTQGREVRGRKEPKVWVDYSGVIKGGLAVAFDAKSTKSADRFPFSMVSPFQREKLATVAQMGGIAFLLVRRREIDGGMRGADYVFPVDADGAIAGVTDRKSIRWDAAGDCRLGGTETWLDRVYGWLRAEVA